MRSDHYLLNIFLALALLFPTFLISLDTDSVMVQGADDDPPIRGPVEAGSVIKVKGGSQIYNSSNYFPVPKDSTLEGLNVSISPIPYIDNGNNYPSNMWFNISGRKMFEYPSKNGADDYFGQWGRQNVSADGRDSSILMDTSHGVPPSIDILLPKNATVSDAIFNITGHQRDPDSDWLKYFYEGSTGESTGFALSYIDDTDENDLPEILAGSPTGSDNFGFIAKYEYDPDTDDLFLKGSTYAGSYQYGLFGSAISEAFDYPGQSRMVAVGASKETTLMKGTVTLIIFSSMTRYDTLEGNDSNEGFGYAVEVGDIDNDGDAEIIAGSPMANSGEGKIYILDLDSNGDFSSGTSLKAVIEGPTGETNFGRNISIGDVDGDSVLDIAVSSNEKIRIYSGGSSMDFDPDYTIDPIASGGVSSFDRIEFIGDISGTGEEILSVGCPGPISGSVLLYNNPSGGTLNLLKTYTPTGSMSSINFGRSVSIACDYDKDGNLEFAISATGDESSRGSIGIYQIDSTTPEKILSESSVGSMYGYDMLFCADMLQNGYTDLVAGATYYASSSSIANGRLYIEEFFDASTLEENPPTVKINGVNVWSYSGSHLSETVQTADLKDAINNAIISSDVVEGVSTPFNEFVAITLALTSPDIEDLEDSRLFSVDGINIRYDHVVNFPDLSGMIQNYIANPNVKPKSDGTFHVPFLLKSDTAGGLSIDTVIQDFDYPPDIENPIQYITLTEDTHNRYLLDLWHVFEDDKTPDEELTFVVVNDGINRSMISATIWQDRYLSIDAFNDTSDTKSNDNWTGQIPLTIVTRDGLDAIRALEDLVIEITPVNDPPMLGNDPGNFVIQDGLFEFIPDVVDAEGDEYDIIMNGPGNMTFVENLNVNWYPNNWDVGNHTWTLTISDHEDTIHYEFELDVINTNDLPYFISYPPLYNTVYIDETFTFEFIAEDIDPNDSLSFKIMKGLQGSLIDEETGVFTWTPLIFQYDPVEYVIRITDNSRNYTEYTFYINLTLRLLEPEITSEPDLVLFDMNVWSYDVQVYDPNDDIPLVIFIEGPDGMEFSNITHVLTWRPLANQTGVHRVALRVISSGYSIDHTFNLTVQRAIRIWNLVISEDLEGKKVSGTFLFTGSLNVTPSDVEYVHVRIDDEGWVNATLIEGIWSHEINSEDYGNGKHTLSVRAFDGHEWSDTETIEIRISNDAGAIPIWLTIILIVLIIIILVCAIAATIYFIQNKMKKSEEDEVHKITKNDFDQSKEELDKFLYDVGSDVSDDTSIYEDEMAPMDLEELVHDHNVIECSDETKIFDKECTEIFELGEDVESDKTSSDIDAANLSKNHPMNEEIPQQDPPDITSDDDTAEE